MIHTGRKWYFRNCDELPALAAQLKAERMPFYAAFRTASGTVWANDTGPDSRFRPIVALRRDGEGDFWVIATVTVDTCDAAELLEQLQQADAYDGAFEGQHIDGRQICPEPR